MCDEKCMLFRRLKAVNTSCTMHNITVVPYSAFHVWTQARFLMGFHYVTFGFLLHHDLWLWSTCELWINSRDPGLFLTRDLSRDILKKYRDFPVWFFINQNMHFIDFTDKYTRINDKFHERNIILISWINFISAFFSKNISAFLFQKFFSCINKSILKKNMN